MNVRLVGTLLSLVLCCALPALAQPAHQVADLNTMREDYTDSLYTGQEFVVVGTTVFFLQEDGIHGVELWKTDGTEAGTVILKDICPGACWGWPRSLTVWNGALYFSADDGVHGVEPWRSDGTTAGTAMLRDLDPGLPGSYASFQEAGGTLYLSADDGVHGRELWKTDGTGAGTGLVADLRPGAAGSDPAFRIDVDGKLLFNTDDGVHGREPWLSDGTAAGTAMLADINPGAGASSNAIPSYNWENDVLALGGGAFLFQADDGIHGAELWKSDGTAAGTALLVDIDPGSGSSTVHGFTRLGSQILFAASQAFDSEVWSTDGTAAGTLRISGISPGGNSNVLQLTAIGSQAFFVGWDGNVTGFELWKTDGTTAGTVEVKDINPGPGFGINLYVRRLFRAFNGGALFFADDGTHGVELWKTDGTGAGTVMVKDVEPGLGWGADRGYSGIAVVGGTAFFRGLTAAHGTEIWKTDGTDAGTVEVKNVETLTSSFHVVNDYPVGSCRNLGGKLLCEADGGVSGVEPWISDGTTAGTVQLGDFAPGPDWSTPVDSFAVGGTTLLGSGYGLWSTDGTPAGTVQILPGVIQSAGGFLSALGTVLFTAQDPAAGTELWKTDGTAAGTARIKDIVPGTGNAYPYLLTPLGSAVLFAANDGGPGYSKLWRTDGTAAGTYVLTTSSITDIQWIAPLGSVALFAATVSGAGRELCVTDGAGGTYLLKDLRTGAASSEPVQPVRIGGAVLFSAFDDATGEELWVSDGTAAGTALLKDIQPGAGSAIDPYPAWARGDVRVLVGNTFFFLADDGVHGRELWKTDGTAAGTVAVADLFPGARSSDIDRMTVAAGRLFFVADDGTHGRELWVSDGTAAGTRMVKDAVPGPGSPVIENLRAVGHLVLFSADDGVHGRELWRSDGGPAGTFQVQDIAAGAAPSSPLDFTEVGGTVFFAANDNVAGFEIWGAPKSDLFTTFQDVPSTFWAWSSIEALTASGITNGCTPTGYCPDRTVSRAEMAIFLGRGLHGAAFVPPAATGTRFDDVPASYWAGSWIEQIAADGITLGCGASPPLFCPERTLARAEMAIFLLRARHGAAYTPPPATGTRFTDVPADYWAAGWIEQLAAEGITNGCAPDLYCPGRLVKRDEMAVFLARAFNLVLP